MQKAIEIGKILNIIGYVLVALILILELPIVLPKAFGIETYVVESNSMYPAYRKGGLLYVSTKVRGSELVVGDAVTFTVGSSDTLLTHRIIEIDYDNKAFKTKGDNNYLEDEWTAFDNLIGKGVFFVPLYGTIAQFMQSRNGYIAVAAVLVCAILLFVVGDGMKKNSKRTEPDSTGKKDVSIDENEAVPKSNDTEHQ